MKSAVMTNKDTKSHEDEAVVAGCDTGDWRLMLLLSSMTIIIVVTMTTQAVDE